jgi:hypothetical protein
MKRLIFILTLIIPLIISGQQSNIMDKMSCYELQVAGINSWERGDYLVRSLEKMNLIIFGSFSLASQQVYILLSDKNQLSNIVTYVENAINGYKLLDYREIPMTEDIFLEIYEQRRGLVKDEISQSKPEYIQLGAKEVISKQLYEEAIRIWESRYSGNTIKRGAVDFSQRSMQQEYYKVVFEIDKQVDEQMLDEIHNALKESEKITDVNRCGEGCFEIYSYEEIVPEYVSEIISKYGVEINTRSLI